MERRHAVEEVRAVAGAGVDGAHGLLLVGDAVPHRRFDTVFQQKFHQFGRLVQLGRKGHYPDLALPRLDELPGKPQIDRQN